MGKYKIDVTEENCTFCLRCQLGCSDAYFKSFNQNNARIRVKTTGLDCTISFTDECRKCGICAENCFFGVLQKTSMEETV
jgi:Pyruvate/2-oxoacid:ferredoxin oxidoreductase delta subunit